MWLKTKHIKDSYYCRQPQNKSKFAQISVIIIEHNDKTEIAY